MQWLLDVTVSNVGKAEMVLRHNSHKVPGAVAEAASKRKQDKYADVENFVPFAIETGGRICVAGSEFVDFITKPPDAAEALGPGPTPRSLQKARCSPCGFRRSNAYASEFPGQDAHQAGSGALASGCGGAFECKWVCFASVCLVMLLTLWFFFLSLQWLYLVLVVRRWIDVFELEFLTQFLCVFVG